MQTKLILAVIAFGFLSALGGQLTKAITCIKLAAVQAQKNDVISLGKLNRGLNR